MKGREKKGEGKEGDEEGNEEGEGMGKEIERRQREGNSWREVKKGE